MASFSAASANVFLASPNKILSIGPNATTQRGAASSINFHPKELKLIYPSGKFIVVRSIDNPDDCFIYRGHAVQTTVAKFSPNGYWVCSADTSGKVRVWSWDHPEHLLKLETSVFNGPVLDVDWDMESKKIVAVGEGTEIMAKCFMWDTGNSVGEMVGHHKRILSVAYKPNRPFRIATCAEDFRTLFYSGPPFKLDHSNTNHTNFVNCVRYSPDGSTFVSVGSDKKIQFYTGDKGEPSGEIVDAHGGSIYSVCFSPDGAKILTASGDKTVKLWDVASKALEREFSFSEDPQIGDMQVAVTWIKSHMISISLNGDINFLHESSPTPVRRIQGHQVAITAMHLDRVSSILYTGSFDGVVISRNLKTGETSKVLGTDKKIISGGSHAGKVVGLSFDRGELVSVGWDDAIRFANIETGRYLTDIRLGSQPSGIASSPAKNIVALSTNVQIQIYREKSLLTSIAGLTYSPTCIAISTDGEELAVGGDDNKIHIYTFNESDNSITLKTEITSASAISAVAYSPDGNFLAVGTNGRIIEVYERATWAPKILGKWVFHTSKVTCLSWSPSGKFLASGSLDENIFIWDFEEHGSKKQLQFAHMGGVSGIDWIDENTLVSCGADHTVVTWNR